MHVHRIDFSATPTPNNTAQYSLPIFDELKQTLSNAKTEMDDHFDGPQNEEFSKFWKEFDPFRHERIIAANMGNTINVSNSWLKCHELTSHFSLLGFPSIVHFDNAALPGAFIASVHHNAVVTGVPYAWYASSLYDTSQRPGHLRATQRTLSPLRDKYRLFTNYRSHWLMSTNNNGDVLVAANQLDFVTKLSDKHVNLYTSDLGFDVSDDYNKQERLHLPVNCGQILTGLLTLAPGGNFIIKQYTTFEPATISFMYALSQMFVEFYICKPVTSRRVNSETYLVGKGYRPKQTYIDAFFARIRGTVGYEVPLFAVADYPPIFLTEVLTFSKLLCARQVSAIETNIALTQQSIMLHSNFAGPPRHTPIVVTTIKQFSSEVAQWYVRHPILPIAHRDMLQMFDSLRQRWNAKRTRQHQYNGHKKTRHRPQGSQGSRKSRRSSATGSWRRAAK